MKNRLFHDVPVTEVLYHNPLEHRRRHARVPHPLRVHHHDRAAGTDAETRRLTALHAACPEQETFTLEQLREQTVEDAAATVG